LCASGYPQQQPSKIKNDIPAITRRALPAVGLILVSDSTGKEIGQGSGFVVSPDGKVITNYHVIQGASSAIIKFPNGAFYGIEGVLALDKDRDLALLKASGKDFPVLALGSSGSTQIGEGVIAIGNPLSLEATVSNGIVSAIREIKQRNLKIIQTTAPISAGSSGGVLLNLRGQVIGVTAFHLLPGENLNFAIAADYIRPLLASKTVTPFAPETVAAAVENEETPQASPESEGEPGYETCGCAVTKDVLVFRTSSSYYYFGHVPCGEKLTVFGKEKGRVKVKTAGGVEGYISSMFVCKVNIPENIENMPKEWINLEDGSIWTVRVDQDHFYGILQTTDQEFKRGDVSYKLKSAICEEKRQDNEWRGECRYQLLLENWLLGESAVCSLTLGERIKSITPHRIDGIEQVSGEIAKPGDCPTSGFRWNDYALIPKE
jgi:hypothetical protein